MPGSQTVTGGIWQLARFWLLPPSPNLPLKPPKRATPITLPPRPAATNGAGTTTGTGERRRAPRTLNPNPRDNTGRVGQERNGEAKRRNLINGGGAGDPDMARWRPAVSGSLNHEEREARDQGLD